MGTVLRTRSVEFMPLPLSQGTLGCSSSWSAYAIYVGDATILVPNALGVALAAAQLALYAYVSCGKGAAVAPAGGAAGMEEGGEEPLPRRDSADALLPPESSGAPAGGGYAPPLPTAVVA